MQKIFIDPDFNGCKIRGNRVSLPGVRTGTNGKLNASVSDDGLRLKQTQKVTDQKIGIYNIPFGFLSQYLLFG